MKVTVIIHGKDSQSEYSRKPFYMGDEADLQQTMADVEEFVSDKYFELNEEV